MYEGETKCLWAEEGKNGTIWKRIRGSTKGRCMEVMKEDMKKWRGDRGCQGCCWGKGLIFCGNTLIFCGNPLISCGDPLIFCSSTRNWISRKKKMSCAISPFDFCICPFTTFKMFTSLVDLIICNNNRVVLYIIWY